ncbi:MAG TPA: pirin family protein [Kiloniellaceae bacterium]|nr:pirin family protein [Kiloniellaceae bacterium]
MTTRGEEESGTPVLQSLAPIVHDMGGFEVRRILPAKGRKAVGPFVFFDHFGPAVLAGDRPLAVRPHPHIGLSTLTWLFEGSVMHRDSLGHAQEIAPGAVNWMTAGAGIVHSERTPARLLGRENPLHGLQVWLALPKAQEETAPSFQHVAADELPMIEGEGLRATLVAGQAWGRKAPVKVFADTLYADIRLAAGATLEVEKDHEERALYLVSGRVAIAGRDYAPGVMLVLDSAATVEVGALEHTHLVLVGGARLDGPRHLWWNLVSSDRARIERAKADWRAGRFPKVPGDEEEFIPLPED